MDVSFSTFFQGFRQRWKLFAGFVLAAWFLGTVYVIFTPLRYSASNVFYVDDALNNNQQQSGLAGLAASVGLGAPQSTGKQVTIATLRSRQLATQFVDHFHLLPVLFPAVWDSAKKSWTVSGKKIPSLEAGAGKLQSISKVTEDTQSGTITFSVNYPRPDMVAWLANNYVSFADDVLRHRALVRSQDSLNYLKTQIRDDITSELRTSIIKLMESHLQHITLINTHGPYQLNVIDPATTPNTPSWPRKTLIFAALTLFALFAAMLTSVAIDLRNARAGS